MLTRFIREVADEELFLDPTDRLTEQRTNTWILGYGADEGPDDLSIPDVIQAFEDCAAALGRRLIAEDRVQPAVFSVWHDLQAGNLRCSTSTFPADQLPFGCTVTLTPLEPILEAYKQDPGYIPWSDLTVYTQGDEPPDDPAEESEYSLNVWATQVGSA